MTKLHRFFFFFWKIAMRVDGIKKGTFFSIYSEEKKRNIQGVVTSLSGESIDKNQFCCDINIIWLEPLQGNDTRYYSGGSYSYKDAVNKLRKC